MPEPTPYGLSKLFSQLVGRKVQFSSTLAAPATNIKQMYGIYQVFPRELAIVVTVDFPLLGSFGGLLVGLPDSAIKEHLRASPMEELLRDAIYEVLNIASAAITADGRAIFTKMVEDPAYLEGAALTVYTKPDHKSYFNVSVDGYQGGKFTISSQAAPAASAAAV